MGDNLKELFAGVAMPVESVKKFGIGIYKKNSRSRKGELVKG